jgi:uncharacterized protein
MQLNLYKEKNDLHFQSIILKKTEEFVFHKLSGETTGHDWWHIDRVRKLSLYIAKKENADLYIIELAALLHDIADHKFHGGDESIGPKTAKDWLESLDVSSEIIEQICDIIATISFKGAKVNSLMKTKEGMIVQDADRLDALGAIGIARCFAYGGYKGNSLYDPNIKTIMHESFAQYKNSKTTSINHFYEKLLLLKDLMNTQTAKIIAEERHDFMQQFLNEFFKEWNVNL